MLFVQRGSPIRFRFIMYMMSIIAGIGASEAPAQESLHEKAVKGGGQLMLAYTDDARTVYRSLHELAEKSDLICTGKLVGKRGRFNSERTAVITDHTFTIDVVYKGNKKNGNNVIVRMNGGRAGFSDGSMVTATAFDERPVEKETTYVIFAQKGKGDDRGYAVTGGAQGLFELNAGTGLVKPLYLNRTHPVVKTYENTRIDQFLAAVDDAVAAKP
jgi:hypothetical protein